MTSAYLISVFTSVYILTVAAWRFITYEARTLETYIPLTGLLILPLLPLIPLYTIGIPETLYIPLCVLLATMDGLIIFHTWKHYINGKMFRYTNMEGKVCVVTGANTGIGRETVRFLGEMGAHVVLACRSEARAKDAIAKILKSTTRISPSQLEFMTCDVSSLASVRQFVEAYQARGFPGLNVLINNAGVMLNGRGLTPEGLESTMATNHYGHFLLTNLLLPELEKVEDGRIINVTSSLHKVPRKLEMTDLAFEEGYSLFYAYSQSKLANVVFTFELQRQLSEKDKSTVTANAVHPGNVQTEVTRNMPWFLYWGLRIFAPLVNCYRKTAPAGAYTSVHVATSPQLRGIGGKYFVNGKDTNDVSALSHDRQLGQDFWAVSERICQMKTSSFTPFSSSNAHREGQRQ